MDLLLILLQELKYLGCSGVKISFEDEGATLNDVLIIRQLTHMVGLELSVKIGGCEAKRDITDCNDIINCDTIVAPMVESQFALNKFILSLNEYNCNKKKGFNLETLNSYNNLNTIENEFDKIDFVTFGRVDYTYSIGKKRDYVDNDEIYNVVCNVFKTAKKKHIQCYLGGAISISSKQFINKLICNNLIDYFETRYIIFDITKVDMNNYDKIINLSNKFELLWLCYKQDKYSSLNCKNAQRIELIQTRIT